MNKKARVIALYLPQYHPTPENNEWWGKGFTEWTNVGKARPLFKGHYQPRVPADLGYYDLRVPEVREQQAKMAKDAGVEGFMYWHYWFGNGKKLLELPFQEVLASGKPDFPFCLGWANHNWEKKTWSPSNSFKKNEMLVEQLYLGTEDYRNHFFYVLDALKDKRYICIDEKPVFYIYNPLRFKDVQQFISLWQTLARENGLNGIYFIGQAFQNVDCEKILRLGFSGVARDGISPTLKMIDGSFLHKIRCGVKKYIKFLIPLKYRYTDIIKNWVVPDLDKGENIFPMIIPNFDHSPRSEKNGFIIVNSTPDLFKKHIREVVSTVTSKVDDHKVIFLRSWNEWGEGNYVEPDLKFGHGYLNAIREEIFKT